MDERTEKVTSKDPFRINARDLKMEISTTVINPSSDVFRDDTDRVLFVNQGKKYYFFFCNAYSHNKTKNVDGKPFIVLTQPNPFSCYND